MALESDVESARATRGRLFDSLSQFWRGLVQPSPLAIGLAIGLNAIAFGALALFLSPEALAGSARRFLMEDQYDRRANVVGKVLALQATSAPTIVVFGGSLIVRCIAGESQLASGIARHGGAPGSEVYDLTVDGQTTWDMAALAEQFVTDARGVLVIGIGPEVLGHSRVELLDVARNPRVPFRAAVLDSLATNAGHMVDPPIGNYFVDNWRFFAARRWFVPRNLINPVSPEPGDPFGREWMRAVNNPEFWASEIRSVTGLAKQYDGHKLGNYAVLAGIARRATEGGRMSVVLLEAPVNPRWKREPAGHAFYTRYRTELRQFAEQLNLPFVSITDRATLAETDFVDYEGHLGVAAARDRCTDALAAELVERGVISSANGTQPR